jgi:hypothetical protein
MTDPSVLVRAPRWVTVADVLVCALAILAGWAALTGKGIGLHWGDIRFHATSALRLSLWATLLCALRHGFFRQQSLWRRLTISVHWLRPWLREPLDDARPALGPLRPLELVLVAGLMAALTAMLVHVQLANLDAVNDLGDPLFSVWRLDWIAHQLPRDPLHLFDANIFYPERYTLAFSDAILLPGILAAPLVWLGVPSVPLYNILMLVALVAAGVAMYALVRALTHQRAAAVVAGVIFAFYPFHFEHYSHFELQFSLWMPMVLLALHRTLTWGRLRDGVMTGLALGAQMLSCIYFGILLSAFLVPVWSVLALGAGRARASLRPLALGAAVAVIVSASLFYPYLEVRARHGERSLGEIASWSAKPRDYLMPHASRTTYASGLGPIGSRVHEPEKDLFPGLLVVALAVLALWPPVSAVRLAYVAGLLVAFDASLGMHGYLYPDLVERFLPLRALRVPARSSMLVGFSLAVLAGFGVARITVRLKRPVVRALVAVGLSAVVLFESRVSLSLVPVVPPSAIYQWLQARPPSVVAELPVTAALSEGVRYSYASTVHWQRLLNGNSGFYPESYLTFATLMQTFPDGPSMALLRARGVDYVVVHEEYYGRHAYQTVTAAIGTGADLVEVARARSRNYESRVYRLVK